MSDALIKKAKELSRDKGLPDDVCETLWMLAVLAQDHTVELRFLIGQIESLFEHAKKNADFNGVTLK